MSEQGMPSEGVCKWCGLPWSDCGGECCYSADSERIVGELRAENERLREALRGIEQKSPMTCPGWQASAHEARRALDNVAERPKEYGR